MDYITLTWLFLLGGLVLMVLGLVLPGKPSMNLGLSAVLVAGLRTLGLSDSLFSSLLIWLATVVVLVIGSRLLWTWWKTETHDVDISEAHLNAHGNIVRVLETVTDRTTDGRIQFQGTTWPARAQHGIIPAGGQAFIESSEKGVWIVRAVEPERMAPQQSG